MREMAAWLAAWRPCLKESDMELALALADRAAAERAEGKTICPAQGDIFRALAATPPEAVRAVILGQDPYHTPGVANGLAFSVAPGAKLPPSLRNIFKELSNDLGCPLPASGDLTPWARRGVLLLNTALTVYEGRPASHMGWGWQGFVTAVLEAAAALPQPVVFLLWGAHARSFTAGLDLEHRPKKAVIQSSHPSPLGAAKGSAAAPAFLGSRPFSGANRLLESMGGRAIDWEL